MTRTIRVTDCRRQRRGRPRRGHPLQRPRARYACRQRQPRTQAVADWREGCVAHCPSSRGPGRRLGAARPPPPPARSPPRVGAAILAAALAGGLPGSRRRPTRAAVRAAEGRHPSHACADARAGEPRAHWRRRVLAALTQACCPSQTHTESFI